MAGWARLTAVRCPCCGGAAGLTCGSSSGRRAGMVGPTMAHDEQDQRKKQRVEGGGAAPPGTPAPPAGLLGGENPQLSPGHKRRLVLVWDLDETLLIFNSLLSGSWAAARQLRGDPALAAQVLELGARWEAAILRLCDERFFFNELEDYDQTCLADVHPFDDGASLGGYDFAADGFPPLDRRHSPHSAAQHASGAHPAPFPAAAAGLQHPAQAADGQGPGSCLDSPAARSLDSASLARLAYRFRRIALLHKFGLAALGTAAQRQEWEALYETTDDLTRGWLSHGRALLAGCTSHLGGKAGVPAAGGDGPCSPLSPSMLHALPAVPAERAEPAVEVVHVAVTSGQLIPSLAKLLLFRLTCHIPAEHVWSSRYCGKLRCFERVRERFGPACTYLAIGDGMEEDEAAAALGWPYIRVLLAPAQHYPADTVLSWRPDAATGGPGLPFTELTVEHIARVAGLGPAAARPLTPAEGAHGGSAAAAALEGAEGAYIRCI